MVGNSSKDVVKPRPNPVSRDIGQDRPVDHGVAHGAELDQLKNLASQPGRFC